MKLFKKGDFVGQKYEVFGVLGEGGFGIVYLVYSHETKSAYALKTFRDEYLEDVTIRERFKKEAQVWIELERHPYLVRAYFVHEFSNRLFIAVEHIAPDDEGLNTLEGYLRSRPPDLTQSLRWAIQFCYGMEYAYAKGIKAHRDIKPANIMITYDKTLKISDFGLAGVIGESKVASGIKIDIRQGSVGFSCQTMEGVGFGTPTHMPPEQFINAAGCDERSDIYSFGIVLYQMASGGKLPFLATLPRNDEYEESRRFWVEMYKLHGQAPIPKINTPLSPIIFRCLEKNPINRYFSFKELRQDFETMLKKQTGEIIKVPELKELETWELVNKGISLGVLSRYQEAIACFDKAIEIDPKFFGAWNNKGVTLGSLGKYQEAIACFNRALEINPRYAEAWFNKGVVLGNLGKHQEAIACYDRALAINPRDAKAWYNKGTALGSLGKHQEAIACHDNAIQINLRYDAAWFNKGVALGNLGKYQDEIACYDKAIEINPRHVKAWYNKGVTLGVLGKYQGAIACFDKAVEIDPKFFGAWYGKGVALGSLGKYQEAITCYDRAIEINPKLKKAQLVKQSATATKDKLSYWDFFCKAYATLRRPEDIAKGYKGLHATDSGFNAAFLKYYNVTLDVLESITQTWQSDGRIKIAPAKGGVILYKIEDAPTMSPNLTNGSSSAANAKISITCPQCSAKLNIANSDRSKKIKCPGCSDVFRI